MQPRQTGETALVIGYGNTSRRDDGVGYHVIDALNARLGHPPLSELGSDPDDQAGDIHTLWLPQLAPELAEIVSRYDLAIFVDAHTGAYPEDLCVAPLTPVYHSSLVSHHLKPETMLALTRDLYGRWPRAMLISVRGYDFDFGTSLSPRTQELADAALQEIIRLLAPPS